jgi:ribonuclease HI
MNQLWCPIKQHWYNNKKLWCSTKKLRYTNKQFSARWSNFGLDETTLVHE